MKDDNSSQGHSEEGLSGHLKKGDSKKSGPNEADRSEEFLRLWLKYESNIFSMIFSFVPHWSDAEDVMQEVSLVLWRKFDEFQVGTSFLAWACAVVRYQVLALRKRQRALKSRLNTELLQEIAGSMAEVLEDISCERRSALEHCLGRLKDREQQVVRLRYQMNNSPEGVARALDKTREAIYKSLGRIHSRLLDCIESFLRRTTGDELGLH